MLETHNHPTGTVSWTAGGKGNQEKQLSRGQTHCDLAPCACTLSKQPHLPPPLTPAPGTPHCIR